MANYGELEKSCRILAGTIGILLMARARSASGASRWPGDRLGHLHPWAADQDGQVAPQDGHALAILGRRPLSARRKHLGRPCPAFLPKTAKTATPSLPRPWVIAAAVQD